MIFVKSGLDVGRKSVTLLTIITVGVSIWVSPDTDHPERQSCPWIHGC
jgi:hypothetical protein